MILILANLVPVFGALFLGWQLADVMVIYWAESAVIGFYTLLKLAVIARWFALIAGPFFVAHFGAFMAVHFLLLYSLFIGGADAPTDGALAHMARMVVGLWPALAGLFISHGISFFENFLGRREYARLTTHQQMKAPYGRIVFMHLALILGGLLAVVLGSAAPVLLLVLAAKIIFDVRAHLHEHAGLRADQEGIQSEKR